MAFFERDPVANEEAVDCAGGEGDGVIAARGRHANTEPLGCGSARRACLHSHDQSLA
jgi:hypothetical protein